MSMVVADLHVHTQVSDGTLTLSEVPAAATEAGVDVVAITDHDRLNPELDGPVTTREGVTVVHGIELRVEAADQRVDLLGYGVRPHPALLDLSRHLQRDRLDRGRRIIDRVEDHLGLQLDVEAREGIGRTHIARAIADSEADYGYTDAFEHLIGDDGPCYVARDIPTFEEGRAVLQAACAVVGLAHPLRYGDPASALALAAELDAVELYYPYGDDRDPEPVVETARAHDLLVTGGTDAHQKTLGVTGIEGADAEAFLAALGE